MIKAAENNENFSGLTARRLSKRYSVNKKPTAGDLKVNLTERTKSHDQLFSLTNPSELVASLFSINNEVLKMDDH